MPEESTDETEDDENKTKVPEITAITSKRPPEGEQEDWLELKLELLEQIRETWNLNLVEDTWCLQQVKEFGNAHADKSFFLKLLEKDSRQVFWVEFF